ncbi:hypothetical protein EB796_017139 [Bugula neritina]|uniref:Carbohydrate sulfotransferase n=1 Tax=Bugula neritina TaxID=10212 RepID=A0A7J7JE58_BUGNE|nr:hypothetical protein EB796_017139 [Bugula neritina]
MAVAKQGISIVAAIGVISLLLLSLSSNNIKSSGQQDNLKTSASYSHKPVREVILRRTDHHNTQVLTTTDSLIDNAVGERASSRILTAAEMKSRPYQDWLTQDADKLPYNASLVARQQQERHQLIRETCKRPDVKEYILGVTAGHRSLISTHKHVLFCPILKAGSTNILRLLCWFRGPPCSTIKNLKPHNMVPRYLERGNRIAVGNTKDFLSYFSFTLVRNPWRRLVSVYIQKFIETRQGVGFCEIKTRFPRLHKYYRVNREKAMTFVNYLEMCVIGQHKEGGILAQNGHWRPQYHMCSFCDLEYTFIGKIETMKSDERVILNAFGFEDIDQTIADANSHLLPNEKANKTSILYEDLWRDVSDSTLKYLQDLYRIDFEMFQYPNHPLS